MNDLSSKVVRILTKKKLSVSFAESCTGGLLASTITSISGSSKVFNMGIITYSKVIIYYYGKKNYVELKVFTELEPRRT